MRINQVLKRNNPKKRIFTFHDKEVRNNGIAALKAIPIGEGHPIMEMTLKVHRKNRSAAQQALMWLWHEQWFKHFGNAVNEEHLRFKKEYLLPLLLRDRVVEGLHDLYRSATLRLMKHGDDAGLLALYHLISTNALNTKQFSEILNKYDQDATLEGCVFITRGPQYDEAMK